MRLGIRYQLLIPLVTLLLGVVGISVWTGNASATRERRRIEDQVRNVARTLSEARFSLTQGVLEQMKGLSGADYLFVGGGDYVTTLDVPAKPGTALTFLHDLPTPIAPVGDDWQQLELGPTVTISGQDYLCGGVRFQRGSLAGGSLYILYPETLWRDAMWAAIFPSLVLGIFGGLAALALAVGVAQRLSRRIQELERRTRLIAAGDFSPMPLPHRDDELRDLSQSVNDMAQQLAHLQETMRRNERLRLLGQVSGGLAHQLRNAVTGARLAVQLHLSDADAASDTEALQVALRQLTLMEVNLKRFLELGRAEELRIETCSFTQMVAETVALLKPRCLHAHIDLRWQVPDNPGLIPADAGQLGQLLMNLLSNAVEAAGPNGWVEIHGPRLQTNPQDATQNAILDIIDSGPGPPPDIAERLFEPFVTGKRDGVGLGLAIARQVAEAHGGRLHWSRQKDRTCFHIELPVEKIISV